MLACIVLTFIITLFWNDYFVHVLGEMGQHVFMDYFWSVCDSMNNPYTVMKVIYPPFIVVVYSFIGHFTLSYVTQDTGDLYIDMYNSQIPMMVFIILMGLSIFLLLTVCRRSMSKVLDDKETALFVFAILTSFPFIIAFQNGNSIILSIALIILFLLGYRSEKRWIRYCAYICLAMVAGMKISPAIFVLLILRERKYREFLTCCLAIAIVVFVPIVFTDGTIMDVIENLFVIERDTGGSFNNIPKLFYALSNYLGIPVIDTIGAVITEVVTALTIIIMILDSKMKQWMAVTLAVMCIINGFGVGTPYLYMYVIIAIVFFLREEKEATRMNVFYLVLLALPLMLFTMDIIGLKVASTMVLFAILLVIGIMDLLSMLKENTVKKEVNNDN